MDKLKTYRVEYYTLSDGKDYRIVQARNGDEALQKVKDMPHSNFCSKYAVYLVR